MAHRAAAGAPTAPVVTSSKHALHRPLGLGEVRLTGGELGDWQELNAAATIPHCIVKIEEWGILDNLRRVIGESGRDFRGFWFADSDLYKVIEAVAWEIARTGTTEFDTWLDDVVDLLARVQEPTGYLHSYHQGVAPAEKFTAPAHPRDVRPGPPDPGRCRAGPGQRPHRPARAVPPVRRPRRPPVRSRARARHLRSPRASRRRSWSSTARPASGATSSSPPTRSRSGVTACSRPADSAPATSRTTRPCGRPATPSATPSARSTSTPASRTSTSRRATSRCSRRWTRSGPVRTSARCTSPVRSARVTATRRSATTTSCPASAPTPRPARPSPTSTGPGACCWRAALPVPLPTPRRSSARSSTPCPRRSTPPARGSSTPTRCSCGPTASPRRTRLASAPTGTSAPAAHPTSAASSRSSRPMSRPSRSRRRRRPRSGCTSSPRPTSGFRPVSVGGWSGSGPPTRTPGWSPSTSSPGRRTTPSSRSASPRGQLPASCTARTA